MSILPDFRTSSPEEILREAADLVRAAETGEPFTVNYGGIAVGDKTHMDVATGHDGAIKIDFETAGADVVIRGMTDQDAHDLACALWWTVKEREAVRADRERRILARRAA